MPNWCQNSIYITGPVAEVSKLHDAINNGQLLETMVPYTDGMTEDSDGSYEWRKSNWGVKWDIAPEDAYFEFVKNGEVAVLNGHYYSAWGPPIEALMAYGNAYPDVLIVNHYFDGGLMFGGTYDSEYGHLEYDTLSINSIPEELEQEFNIAEMFDA